MLAKEINKMPKYSKSCYISRASVKLGTQKTIAIGISTLKSCQMLTQKTGPPNTTTDTVATTPKSHCSHEQPDHHY
jgi:hypothetical protein